MMAILVIASCNQHQNQEANVEQAATAGAPLDGGSATIQDDVSMRNILQIAVSSADHSTLVTAVKAADYVDVLATAGPFTVFAPVNAAFDKLPAGTVEGLLKPEKKADLQNILEYHVIAGAYKPEYFRDGKAIGVANGGRVTIGVKDGKITVNGANIIGSVQGSNGWVHLIDQVLLPQ
ncbi:MAG: fasciclin domain-containing protein [Bacteroidetes bacterium]|nr:fasciclin domain-containing protein [Bacteroidota bacterium]